MPTTPESYEGATRKLFRPVSTKRGGRFGGDQEQRAGKPSRGGMRKSAPRLTMSDYDGAKI